MDPRVRSCAFHRTAAEVSPSLARARAGTAGQERAAIWRQRDGTTGRKSPCRVAPSGHKSQPSGPAGLLLRAGRLAPPRPTWWL